MKTKAQNKQEKPAAMPSTTEQIAAINTRQGREMEKAIGPAPVDFDAAAMEAELEAVRQKHMKGLNDRLEDFESKRAELDVEIDRLRGILGLGSGRRKTGRATARLSDEARAKAEADAIAFVAENKDGVGRAAAISGPTSRR